MRPLLRNKASLPLACMIALALGAGCSSVPSDVADAKNLRVSYYDFRTGSELTLVNEDDPRYADVYSQPRRKATLKLAPRERLEEFVRFAADHGFFERAEPADGPEDVSDRAAFRMIVIAGDGEGHAFILRPGLGAADLDAVREFTNVQTGLLRLYNSIQQLQFVPVEGNGADFFERERERLRKENLERLRKRGGGR